MTLFILKIHHITKIPRAICFCWQSKICSLYLAKKVISGSTTLLTTILYITEIDKVPDSNSTDTHWTTQHGLRMWTCETGSYKLPFVSFMSWLSEHGWLITSSGKKESVKISVLTKRFLDTWQQAGDNFYLSTLWALAPVFIHNICTDPPIVYRFFHSYRWPHFWFTLFNNSLKYFPVIMLFLGFLIHYKCTIHIFTCG